MKITMDVNADGSVPQVAVIIPGHDVSAVIFKVTSTVAVENYVGIFRNTDAESPDLNNSGTLNLTISGNDAQLLSKCSSGDCGEVSKLSGKVVRSASEFTITFDNCDTRESICILNYTKNGNVYQYKEVMDKGVEFYTELKKVP